LGGGAFEGANFSVRRGYSPPPIKLRGLDGGEGGCSPLLTPQPSQNRHCPSLLLPDLKNVPNDPLRGRGAHDIKTYSKQV